MSLRPLPAVLVTLALCGAACGGPLTPSPIEGEPICADFDLGGTRGKMRGSLRFPVQVTVFDGNEQLSRVTLYGRRTQDDPGSRIMIPDANDEYEVKWAQCANERAPRPLTLVRESKETASYECGDAKVYKTETIAVKEKDEKSRTLKFADPPNAECWKGEAPPADAAGAPDAGAPDAAVALEAPAAADAGAAGASDAPDAGAADAAAPAADGGGADAGDGGAKKKKKAATPGTATPGTAAPAPATPYP